MLLLGIIVFLSLSALFSGSEIAYVSSNKLRVELKKKRNNLRSRILSYWFDEPADFLSTMLVGNNIALVVFTGLMAIPLTGWLAPLIGASSDLIQLLVKTVVITLIVLVFGEFLPKTIFRSFSDDALYFFAVPLRALQWILYLPSQLMTRTSNGLLRLLFKQPREELDTVLTRTDLEAFVNESRPTDEETSSFDRELFGKALNLSEVRISDCMIPRNEIQSIDLAASIEELEAFFQTTRLSRILVIDGEIDNVMGYVHHQQLFSFPDVIASIVLELPFIPEVTRVPDLLDRFIRDKLSIACVVDEYGGVSGIVTMEDLLEQIFGEIEDEHDADEYREEIIAPNRFHFSGRLEVNYLNEKYDLGIPEGEYHTLSGYIVTCSGRVPEQDEQIELDNFIFKLTDVSNTKIETVKVTKLEPEGEIGGG
ncbi:MAG: hemolysin family protein [Bacteroidota bacterium]